MSNTPSQTEELAKAPALPSQPRSLLSFIVPASDTECSPKEVYEEIRKQTEQLDTNWEVLFVDHGLCEKTWLHIQGLARKDPQHVRAYIFSEFQNRASALALGYRESKGDLVFTIEADQQDDPSELRSFLQRIDWDNSPAPQKDSQWQNILPRGVLRSSKQAVAAA